MKTLALRKLLRQVHENEDGAITLETILIIGAIALPILVFLIKFGWPRIKNYFEAGLTDLETAGDQVKQGQDPTGGGAIP